MRKDMTVGVFDDEDMEWHVPVAYVQAKTDKCTNVQNEEFF